MHARHNREGSHTRHTAGKVVMQGTAGKIIISPSPSWPSSSGAPPLYPAGDVSGRSPLSAQCTHSHSPGPLHLGPDTMPLSLSVKKAPRAPLAHVVSTTLNEPRQSSLVDHLHKGQDPWWGKQHPEQRPPATCAHCTSMMMILTTGWG